MEQEQRGPVANEPAPPDDDEGEEKQPGGGEEGQEESGHGQGAFKLRLAAMRRRLAALLPRAQTLRGFSRRAAAAAAALTLALLLAGLLASRGARSRQSQLAAVRDQLASQRSEAAAVAGTLSAQLSELQRSVAHLGGQLRASTTALAALELRQAEQAAAAERLRAGLADTHDDVSALQVAVAAGSAAAAAAAPNATAEHWQRLRRLVREEAEAALELFSADRTGQPDWALAAVGAAVVAHSRTHPPPGAAGGGGLGAMLPRLHSGGVHPQATKVGGVGRAG